MITKVARIHPRSMRFHWVASQTQSNSRKSIFAQHRSDEYRRNYTQGTTSPAFEPLGETLQLPSGRVLGYHTSGPTDGVPVIYIHGNPDSGIQVTGDLEVRIANKLGVRWIGPDRPGVGLSTMYEDQRVTDYPDDMRHLVEHLSLDKFFIIGTSGGTGYALACAKDLSPSRLKGVGICAGVGPVDCGFESMGSTILEAWNMWREYPKEMEAYIEAEYVHLARAQDSTALRAKLETDLKSYLLGDDLEHILEDVMLDSVVRGYRQIYAQGARAHAKGIEVNMQSWGFRLDQIKFPGIRFWYGGKDVNTTPIMGRYMADRVIDADYKEYPGKSHITIWNEETLEEMLISTKRLIIL